MFASSWLVTMTLVEPNAVTMGISIFLVWFWSGATCWVLRLLSSALRFMSARCLAAMPAIVAIILATPM